MRYLRFLFLASVFQVGVAEATPPILQAIEYYEAGNYRQAAALFENLYGPLAQAYKDALVERGEMDQRHKLPGSFEGNPWHDRARSYVVVSEKAKEYLHLGRTLKLRRGRRRGAARGIKGKFDRFRKELGDINDYASVRLNSMVFTKEMADEKTKGLNLVTSTIIMEPRFIDVRNLLHFGRDQLGNVKVELRGVNVFDELVGIEDQIEEVGIGNAFFNLSEVLRDGEDDPQHPWHLHILKTAAFYGSVDALKLVSQMFSNGYANASFWTANYVQYPDAPATWVDTLAEHYWVGDFGLPQDRSIILHYCFEALKRNKIQQDPLVYNNAFVRLGKLTPKDKGIIGHALKSVNLFLAKFDENLHNLDKMWSMAVEMQSHGKKYYTAGYALMERVYECCMDNPEYFESSGLTPTKVLHDLFAFCTSHKDLDATPYLELAAAEVKNDINLAYVLALFLQGEQERLVSPETAHEIVTVLDSIDSEDFPHAKYAQGILVDEYNLGESAPYFEAGSADGHPLARYRYLCALPHTAEFQEEVESGLRELLASTYDFIDPVSLHSMQNHLGLRLKDKDCSGEERVLADQEAVELFTSAAEHPKVRAIALFNLALLHSNYRAGDEASPATAIPLFEQCFDEPETCTDAKYEIFRQYMMLGSVEEAMPWLDELVELGHSKAMISKAIFLLDRAAEQHDLVESHSLVAEANDLLVRAKTHESREQAYRAFLFLFGLTNASGDVIIAQRPEKARELVLQLTKSRDFAALSLLKHLCTKALQASGSDSNDSSEDDEAVDPVAPNEGMVDREVRLDDQIESTFEKLQGKTVKSRKVMSILKQSVRKLGGSMSMGRSGSRFHVSLGQQQHVFHMPHGGRGNEFSGAMLEDLRRMMAAAQSSKDDSGEGPSS